MTFSSLNVHGLGPLPSCEQFARQIRGLSPAAGRRWDVFTIFPAARPRPSTRPSSRADEAFWHFRDTPDVIIYQRAWSTLHHKVTQTRLISGHQDTALQHFFISWFLNTARLGEAGGWCQDDAKYSHLSLATTSVDCWAPGPECCDGWDTWHVCGTWHVSVVAESLWSARVSSPLSWLQTS